MQHPPDYPETLALREGISSKSGTTQHQKYMDNKDDRAYFFGQLLLNFTIYCSLLNLYRLTKQKWLALAFPPWSVCYCSYRAQEANFIVGQKIEYGLDGHDRQSQQRVALIRRWNWLSEWHRIWVQWPNASINPVYDGRHLALRRGGGSDVLTRDNMQSEWKGGENIKSDLHVRVIQTVTFTWDH